MIFADKGLMDDGVVFLEGGVLSTPPGERLDQGDRGELVLRLRQGDLEAVEFFRRQLHPFLGEDFLVLVVPSHLPSARQSRLPELAAKLAADHCRREEVNHCLVRVRSVPGVAEESRRSLQVQRESIEVQFPEHIKGRDVLLVDDLVATGYSLRACQELLLDAGARYVQRLALSRADPTHMFDRTPRVHVPRQQTTAHPEEELSVSHSSVETSRERSLAASERKRSSNGGAKRAAAAGTKNSSPKRATSRPKKAKTQAKKKEKAERKRNPGETAETSGRRRTRPLVVDDDPRGGYEERLEKFGSTGADYD